VFLVRSVYFNLRNILPKSGTFLLRHPVYPQTMGIDSSRRIKENAKALICCSFSRFDGKCLARKLSMRLPSKIAPGIV